MHFSPLRVPNIHWLQSYKAWSESSQWIRDYVLLPELTWKVGLLVCLQHLDKGSWSIPKKYLFFVEFYMIHLFKADSNFITSYLVRTCFLLRFHKMVPATWLQKKQHGQESVELFLNFAKITSIRFFEKLLLCSVHLQRLLG